MNPRDELTANKAPSSHFSVEMSCFGLLGGIIPPPWAGGYSLTQVRPSEAEQQERGSERVPCWCCKRNKKHTDPPGSCGVQTHSAPARFLCCVLPVSPAVPAELPLRGGAAPPPRGPGLSSGAGGPTFPCPRLPLIPAPRDHLPNPPPVLPPLAGEGAAPQGRNWALESPASPALPPTRRRSHDPATRVAVPPTEEGTDPGVAPGRSGDVRPPPRAGQAQFRFFPLLPRPLRRRRVPAMKPRHGEVSIPLQPPGRGAPPAAGPAEQPRDYVLWSLFNVLAGYVLACLGCLCFPALVFSIKVRGEQGPPPAGIGAPDAARLPSQLLPGPPAQPGPQRQPRSGTPNPTPATPPLH